MSRSGYSDDLDPLDLGRWRGQVTSATRGKRGQAFFKDLLAALEAMPNKRLVQHELQTGTGEVCALGALGRARDLDMSKIDPSEPEEVSLHFGIAKPLACEVVYMNDEHYSTKDDEVRWVHMRNWVKNQIISETPVPTGPVGWDGKPL